MTTPQILRRCAMWTGLAAIIWALLVVACPAQVMVFCSDDCAPCQRMKPAVHELQGQYELQRINIGYYPDAVKQYGIKALPTTIVFRKGREVSRLVGYLDKSQLEQLCKLSELPAPGRWVIQPRPIAHVGVLDASIVLCWPRWTFIPQEVH